MGIDASKLSSRIKSLVEAKRNKFRRLMCEGLERRELMAFSVLGSDPSDQMAPDAIQNTWNRANRQNDSLGSQGGVSNWRAASISQNASIPVTIDNLKSSNVVLMPEGVFSATPGPVIDNEWFKLANVDTTGLVGEGESTNSGGLLSISPNSGEIFSINRVNQISESPREVTFRFDENIDPTSLAGGIRFRLAAPDGTFGAGSTVVTPPLSIGETPRIVVARFGQQLTDGLYRIEVFTVDIPAEGITALRSATTRPLAPRIQGTDRDIYDFNLELGTRIVAVVPQPIVRLADGALSQDRRAIEIYFNDSELYNLPITTGPGSNPSVVDPQFYALINTRDTVSPNDDVVSNPTSITYDPLQRRAVLTFANDIDAIAGGGTFRIRVGSSEAVASAAAPKSPLNLSLPFDPDGFLSGAFNLGSWNNSFSTVVSEEVRQLINKDPLLNDFPGAKTDPGHRDIQEESHFWQPLGATPAPDTNIEISRIFYSFMDNQSYGVDSQGRSLFSVITPDQRDRVREIYEFYSSMLGIDFVEYSGPVNDGDGVHRVVVGDMFPNGPTSGPGIELGIANPAPDATLLIMDGSETWDNSFGLGSNIAAGTQSFFTATMREVGRMLGLGDSFDLPPGTIQGSELVLGRPGNVLEQIFPGDHDAVHGRNLFRPDNRDVDLYRFEVAPGTRGKLRAETLAERLSDSSTLDSYLSLLRQRPDGSVELVATNNNYFGKDSLVNITLESGIYFLSVTSMGNQDNDPAIQNSGSGGTSQGRYQLRVDFTSLQVPRMTEELAGATNKGSALDGDGDGLAGGDFNFWFRSVAPLAVGEVASETRPARTIIVDKVSAGLNRDGSLVRPFRLISEATAAAKPGDVIRLIGDNRFTDLTLAQAYEIGDAGSPVGVLVDGANLNVPRGVTLVIDSGAILKFAGSKILVGSDDATTDRSNSAIQVLGRPGQPVRFTSHFDQSIGQDTNPLNTTATPGQWGGIEIRNDFDRAQGRLDREREGIFLNSIFQADIQFGGGRVGAGAQARPVSPIHLAEARPVIVGNSISRNADAAISIDPNSFEETLFTEPRYQQVGAFVPDYSRVGPIVYGNTIQSNSINGMFVRIDTVAGEGLKSLSVPARIDDTEIVIVLGENLIINGVPGGPIQEVVGPIVTTLSLTNVAPTIAGGGFAAPAILEYVVTFVDKFGQESLPSAIRNVSVLANRSIRLNNIPIATLDYVARKIYRRDNPANPFQLVETLNRDSTTFVDNGGTKPGSLQTAGLTSVDRARRSASLVIDPGVILKSAGGRIEVGIGATLLAEGTPSNPIIFTSRFDDRYGASGSFDTNNDGTASRGTPEDWGGIVARHLSNLSLDNVVVTFGGGTTRVPGGFASFNAIEIHQANARIANSVIQNNSNGRGTPGTSNRGARGVNDEAAIFVVGSQPVIINNIIRNNNVDRNNVSLNIAAISIDANSLNYESLRDYGRSTGLNQRVNVGIGNFGPLVDNNRLGGNNVNGMRVRGATLTTESIWDDTDIVHVLTSEIFVPDFVNYGGLRLASKVDESLVVKLAGANAGFTASGRPLDIKDRIGGSLHIVGTPGFPVVLTSLADDTIGAGFDFRGNAMLDTNNNGPTAAAPGTWRSVLITPFANDRNVATVVERESDQISGSGSNDSSAASQSLGVLAPNQQGGDENKRLGFTITGAIATPSDLDVYRFTGTAGTPVWFDIDQSSGSLDSIIELIDADGNIIALSNKSINESENGFVFSDPNLIGENRALPMDQLTHMPRNQLSFAQYDFQGINPLDPGLRVVLPGTSGTQNEYYVRVRSSNVSPVPKIVNGIPEDRFSPVRLIDRTLVREGISTGVYKLQVRLQQRQEIAGTSIQFADIRFASTGIDVQGQPLRSQLLGEVGEANPTETNSAPTSSIVLGNVLNNDMGAVSIAGNIQSAGDIDWYDFTIDVDSIAPFSTDYPTRNPHQSVIFDIDYAAGFGRPNTQLWLFQRVGTELLLIATGDNSNVFDDQALLTNSTDNSGLSRGSRSTKDAFIGPFELRPGNYVVAVSNASLSHVLTEQFTRATPSRADANFIRYEPLDSVRRISEDRFDSGLGRAATNLPPVQVAFGPANTTSRPNTNPNFFANAVPFNLSDVTLFAVSGQNVTFVNPLTGAREATYSTTGTSAAIFGPNPNAITDFAVAPNGFTIGYQQNVTAPRQDTNSGTFFGMDIGNGAPTAVASGLTTFLSRQVPDSDPPTFETIQVPDNGVGIIFDGLTFSSQFPTDAGGGQLVPSLWGVASRGSPAAFRQPVLDAGNATVGLSTAGTTNGFGVTKNILYRLNSLNDGNVGQARGAGTRTGGQQGLGAGTNIIENGYFVRTRGFGGGNAAVHSWVDANGTVTGLAVIGNRYFAVTDAGELMGLSITSETAGQVWSDQYVEMRDPSTNQLIRFQSLTTGPRNVEDGRFANMLFGTDNLGRLWAFNTNGVFQPVFPRGAFFVNTDNPGIRGIDFSSLDVNLWHLSREQQGTAGHGRLVSPNGSRDATDDQALKFGYSNPTGGQGVQGGTWTGIYNMGPNNEVNLYGNTSLPGGARGALESHFIDLSQYSPDDQPMLYFNYSLSTEGTNTRRGDNQAMLDSFRVYGAGEDGTWVLLATNNSARNGSYADQINPDEFDVPGNGNQDAFARSYLSQELFDNVGWRQARVNLSPLAGQRDIRIRFEFATGGDFRTGMSRLGGQELVAVPGERLQDGQTFTISGTTFEFDLGLVLNLPSANSLVDGDALLVNGNTFTFRNVPVGPLDIPLVAGQSPAEVAASVRAVLEANGFVVSTSTLTPNVVNIAGLGPEGHGVIGADPNIITGLPGVATGNTPVLVNNAMNAIAVRQAIRTSMAAALNVPGQQTNIDVYRVSGHTIYLHDLIIQDPGPLGATVGRRFGDTFGPLDTAAPDFTQSFRTQNNLNTVVFLDDIIIGFAERGEMVLNAQTFTAATSDLLFVPTFEYEDFGGEDGATASDIETGAYQLEIRSAASYGLSAGSDLQLDTIPIINLQQGRTFDTNERLTKAIALRLDDASSIRDGATFTLSDGINVVTFEFDVVSPTDLRGQGGDPANVAIVVRPDATAGEIIRAVRNAINSPTVQSQIKVSASTNGDMLLAGGDLSAPLSNILQLSGNAAANLTGGIDFGTDGVPFVVIQHGREVSPLGTDFGEDMGDQNVERFQGQMIISATSIINSSGFGINVDAGTQSQVDLATGAGLRSYPGVPRNLVTLNAANVGLGPVIVNNLLANNGSAGIRVSGDPVNTNGNAPRTVARIINNTLYGPISASATAAGTGILINEGAVPTIINNIISKFATGIQYVGPTTGTQPELGANVYQSNVNNLSPANLSESFPLILAASAPLFSNPAAGRFYLRALSTAIDSSVNSVEDRSIIDQVKSAIGIPTSPILAPDFDIVGLRRVDDPAVNTPAGLGENVFTDRGAFERSDFVGPIAVLQRPIDNDANLIDTDRTTTYLIVQSGNYDFFEILLDETSGTGVDPDTVTSTNVILTQNGRQLVEGFDYVRGYGVNSRTLRLTPLAGFWRQDSVYELTLVNRASFRIDAPVGSAIVAGQQIRFNVGTTPIVMEFDLGSGVSAGAIRIPVQSTLTSQEVLGRIYQALATSDLSISANVISSRSLLLHGATNLVLSGGTVGLTSTAVPPIADLAGNSLQANRPNSLTQFTIAMPEVGLDFGDAIERSGTGTTSSTVLTSTSPIVSGARHALYPIDEPLLVLGRYADADSNGQTSPAANADDSDAQITFSAGLGFEVTSAGPIRLAFGPNGPALLGASFTISDNVNNTVVFRFVNNTGVPGVGEIGVNIDSAVTALDVAEAVRSAIKVSTIDRGLLFGITAILDGDQLVIGGTANHRFVTDAAPSFVRRVILGSQTIRVIASPTIDGETLTIQDGSGSTLAFQIIDTSLTASLPLGAGNVPVRVNLSTITNAALAESLRVAINNSIQSRRLNLPTIPSSALVGNELRISANDEDGVAFNGFFNSFNSPVEVTITSTGAGFIDAWVDWNQDNDFNDANEYLFQSVPVRAGQNTFFVTTPASAAVGYTTARFRLSTTGGLLPTGMAIGGEVEDHLIEVLPGRPPITRNDPSTVAGEYRVLEDSVLTVSVADGVLANDQNFDVFPLFVHDFDPFTAPVDPVNAPRNGTLVLNADGSFVYTPNRNFFGQDTFTYLARSTRMTSVTLATVTINVLPVNDAPLGVDDRETIVEDSGDIMLSPNTSTTWNVSRFTANDILGYDPGDPNAVGGVIANELNQSLRIVGARIVTTGRTGEAVSWDTAANTLTFKSGDHYNADIDGPVIIEVDLEDNGVTGVIRTNELNQPTASILPAPLRTTSRITVTITPLNDRPRFTLDQTLLPELEDPTPTLRSYEIVRNITPGPALATDELSSQVVDRFQIRVVANHPNPNSLFTVLPQVVGSSVDTIRRLEYVLAPDINWIIAGGDLANTNGLGDIVLEIVAFDNGPTAPAGNVNESLMQRLTIRVTPVNDAPEFTIPGNHVSNEDAGLITVPGFATSIRSGTTTALDELLGSPTFGINPQTVEFIVESWDTNLFVSIPTISPNGTLVYQIRPDINRNYYNSVGVPGVTPVINPVVSVRLRDNGPVPDLLVPNVNISAIKSFTVVINPINDNPVPGTVTRSAVEDVPLVVSADVLTGAARSGPIDEDLVENQQVRLTSILLQTVRGGVIAPVFAPDNSRILSFTYTPPANYFGPDSVEYVITDNGTDNGVLRELSSIGTLFFDVAPVNDPPTFTPGPNLTLPEDTPAFTVQWATNISPGPANESNQTVSFQVSVINSTLFTPFFVPGFGPSISPTGVLTFTLAQDVNGVVLLEIVAVDSGPSGGVNNDNNRSSVHTMTLTINAINDIPLFSLDRTLVEHIEDPTPALVQLPIVSGVFPSRSTALDELIAQSVSFELTVRAAVPNRFAILPRIVGTGSSRVLEYQLAPDVNRLNSGGDIVVDVQAVDSGAGVAPNVNRSAIVPLTLRISEVNDPPEFELEFNSITINEDAPLQFLPQIYFDERPGPLTAVDEVNQNITRVATVPAGAEVLYAVRPRLNNNGDLEFQYAPDVNSNFAAILGIPNAFHIFLTATDDGRENGVLRPQSTTKTLTVNVTPINDAPAYSLSRNRVNVIEDQGLINVDNFAINVRPAINSTAIDENNQLLTFDLIVSNPSLFAVAPTMDSSGRLTFRTAPNQNGNSIITARLRDNGLAGPPPNSNLGPLLTFTIAVEAINDAPEFTMPSSLQVQEDQGIVSLPGFATGIRPGPESALDENRQVLTFQLISADPALFEIMPSMQADGTLTFRTRLNVNSNTPGINRVVQFQLRDNGAASPTPNTNLSEIQSFTLNITPVNDPPIPGSIRVPGFEDGFVEVGPGQEFEIDDILAVVDAGPVDEVNERQSLRMTQIERTTVRGGQILPVFNGDVIVSFRYIPPSDLSGEDFVRYVVTDNGTPEASATGTITLDVRSLNDPPRFTAGPNINLVEDAPAFQSAWATNIFAGPPSALDEISGPNAQTVSFRIVRFDSNFFAVAPSVTPSGTLSFTLAKDANGATLVEIRAEDSGSGDAPNNNLSAIHTLTISVAAVNDAPSFVLGSAINVPEDSVEFDAPFVTNIVPAEGMNNTPPTGQDENGQTVSFVVTNSNNNLFAVQPSITPAGRLRFVPAPNAFGVVTVTVVAQDSGPSTAPNQNSSTPRTFEINITQVQDAPFAVTDRYNTSEDAVLTINAPGLLANDIDPDLPDDALRIAQPGTIQSTLGATIVLNANGSFSYDPRNSARIQGLSTGQTEVDTFTYTVRDRSDLLSNIGTVSITLTGVNDAPVAVNDRFVVATGVPVNLAILDNDRDVDTPIDVGTVVIGVLPLNGTVTILPSGRVQYTPRVGFVGEDTFSYRVRDSLGALSNEATVQVVSGVSPRAADDLALTARNASIEINVVQNDSAFSGTLDLSTLQIASGPDTGTVVIVGNGVVRYTPATNFVGSGTFQYFISDTNGIPSNLATVTVRVVSSLNQNPTNRYDVDNDGFVSPIDALILINDINLNGDRVLPASTTRPPFLDVDGDGSISPLDVLAVVNFINDRGNAAGEGEGEGMESLGWFQTVEIMSPAKFAEVCEADLTLQIEREIGNYLAASIDDSIGMGPMQFLGDTEEDEDESVEDLLVTGGKGEVDVPSILDDLFAADWS